MTLPRNWQTLSLEALWDVLNDPRRRATPQVVVDAVMVSVRARGIDALREPDVIERLSRCDAAARDEIKRRVSALGEVDAGA